MGNPVQEAQRLGQSIWYDNMRRGLLPSGELRGLIETGVSGLTSNPTIFEKAVAAGADYDEALLALARAGASTQEAYEALVIEDIRAAADLLRPVYDRTQGADGYASLEVSPTLANDTAGTVAEARRLFAALGRPNVMIKVPATPAGIPAIRQLIGDGININVTLIFSLEAYARVREAYIAGLNDLRKKGGPVARVASVASFFVSRVDTAVDGALEKAIAGGRADLRPLLGKAAIANAQLAYRAFKETFGGAKFKALRALGARPQRPLWASTGTKNPAYSDVLYIDSLMGPDTVNTMPPPTLTAFLDHGKTEVALTPKAAAQAAEVLRQIDAAGISMRQVTDKLLADGVKAFADSFDALLADVERKKAALLRTPLAVTGGGQPIIDGVEQAALARLKQGRVVERICARDHTVWRQDPTEIADRLGWLSVVETMTRSAAGLTAFAAEAKDAGFKHAVLLGMGGSSLGPEVLRRTFGSAPGFPELIVLDSTVPDAVRAVDRAIDPASTLFLVSSKSGTTIEPLSLYRYYRDRVERETGYTRAGAHFSAITDPGTPLEHKAREQGFWKVFLNPSDIGGRYSVLSYFGLVPAALMGIDVSLLLARAAKAAAESAAPDSPAARLGGVIAEAALQGRNKLTLVASPAVEGFGLWAEQLIAESLGKDGKGVVPVVGEPLAGPDRYGQDRLFVHLRLGGAASPEDAAVAALAKGGQPVIEIGLGDRHDLGAEFFRWEIATAVAGALLGVHPFDQPDVQAAKDQATRILKVGGAQAVSPSGHVLEAGALSDLARPGDYVAILAYVAETPELNEALSDLRKVVVERYQVATTAGYGPRYLHSTGQLHKGGKDNGVFLVLTGESTSEVRIPGERYSFNALAQAQAQGDLAALVERRRRVLHSSLKGDPAAAVRALAAQVAEARAVGAGR